MINKNNNNMLLGIKSKVLLICAALFACLSMSAQHNPGSWRMLPMSGEHYQQVLDTPSKVFYVTGNSLYSYDKEYQETVYYAPGAKLSDSNVLSLYYNHDNGYVMVVYSNYNIDLIYEDGHIVNMPEVKDANLTVSKKFNDVQFYNNRIYIATEFGIVVYDDQRHQVVESGNYGTSIKKILPTDENLLLFYGQNSFVASPINNRHNSLDKFHNIQNIYIINQVHIKNNEYLYYNDAGGKGSIIKIVIDVPNGKYTFTKQADAPNIKKLCAYKDGFYALLSNAIVYFDKNGDFVSKQSVDTSIVDQLVSTWNGSSSVWVGDSEGLASYDLTTSTPTLLTDKFRPESSMMFKAGYCTPSPDGASVYITNMGLTKFHPAGSDAGFIQVPYICERYDWATGKITPVHPDGVVNTSVNASSAQNSNKSKLFYGGPCVTAVDPVDPSIVYHSNTFEGLVVVKDQKVLYEFNDTNSPLYLGWGTRVMNADFDNNGNLWVGIWRASNVSPNPYQTTSPYKILPAKALEKLRQDPSSVKIEDWIDTKWPSDDQGTGDMRTVFSSKYKNKMLYFNSKYSGALIGLDTKGTTETSDDTFSEYKEFVDQDGVVSWPLYKTALTEDLNGNIWIGTSQGIYVVTDLNQLGEGNTDQLKVRRPKVARSDGTIYADYLLSTERILGIAVDASNRKWIATEHSGAYLVSEDGTEIIRQLTKENSMLLSDCIYVVACDPNGNDVLFGTAEGLFVYSSDSAPAAEDYSEITVYPNPVRPDYTGWITINGLMDNSLIKVADMQGNVLWEGMSEGGMAVWDGCNRGGERVRSGVYLVFASHTENDQTTGAVAKIVVIN